MQDATKWIIVNEGWAVRGSPGYADTFRVHQGSDFAELDAGETATFFATAGTTPGNGIAISGYFLAMAPDGSVLHGYVSGAPNLVTSDSCVFAASVFD